MAAAHGEATGAGSSGGDSPVTGPGREGGLQAAAENTTATSVTLSGLNLGTAYNVEVIGNCTSGASSAGTTSFTTTGGTPTVTYCASKGNSLLVNGLIK